MGTESTQSAPRKEFWDGVRDSLVTGLKDLRDRGDDVARSGRLRMDLVQTQRRLRHAYETLGEAAYKCMKSEKSDAVEDPCLAEHCERVDYYRDEMARIRKELGSNT